jgi:hypothetical protein
MEIEKTDARVVMTTRIWALAIAMMGLCIPLVGIERDLVVLPVFVVLGTVLSTVIIWRPSLRRREETMLLSQSMRELQQELARLQISSTDNDLRRKIDELSVQ